MAAVAVPAGRGERRSSAGPFVVLAIVAGVAALTLTGAGLARRMPLLVASNAPAVLAPRDGASVGSGFDFRLDPGRYAGHQFAVIVDNPLPAPGSVVKAGDATLITELTEMMLTLPPRTGGSPDTANMHVITAVPLDGSGHRIGEQAATVTVRVSP